MLRKISAGNKGKFNIIIRTFECVHQEILQLNHDANIKSLSSAVTFMSSQFNDFMIDYFLL